MKEKRLTPKEARELYFQEVLQRVDDEIERLRDTRSIELDVLQKVSNIMHNLKRKQKLNIEGKIATWQSPLVEEKEKNYLEQIDFNGRINFLINTFLEYRLDHSFGEYDFDVVLDEETEIERCELSNFLIQKFSETQKELKHKTIN